MQLGQSMQLINVFYCSFNCIMFPSVCLQKREICHCPRAVGSLRKASGSWCKGGLTERVTPEEKSDVRRSDASPMGPMGVEMGWGS